jgi:para-nitrobenzyl esterase
MRQKTTAELLAVDSWAYESAIVHGTRLLPTDPALDVAAGNFRHVPVLMGFTHNESLSGMASFYPMTEEDYSGYLEYFFGTDAETVQATYPSSAYSDPFYALGDALNDSGVLGGGACMDIELARQFSAEVPTYVYEFDDPSAPIPTWVTAAPGFVLGSSHGSDEDYWWDRPFDTLAPLTASQMGLAQQMVQYLGAFAEQRAPRAPRLPHWPRLEPTHEQILRFTPGAIAVRTDFTEAHRCEFWGSLGYL